eukprot:TRINITY_DN101916_c0_g1_i1.p1 TRINITY_DN101916_c0_g1~~TRINITY_DN101916_c0_g1_i1.p1  ORF type:complete len:313 (-),score=63.32 TRINITY_DN101916_c0_g1_i1:107-1045(-)
MTASIVQEHVEIMLEMSDEETRDCTQTGTSEMLSFIVSCMRSQNLDSAKCAATGMREVVLKKPLLRPMLKATKLEAALSHVAFLDAELSSIAADISEVLGTDFFLQEAEPMVKHISLEDDVSVLLHLSEPDMQNLSSHGWRVWPGAHVLSNWLIKNAEAVRGLEVLEVGAGPGLVGCVAARLKARRVVLSDRSKPVLEKLLLTVQENGLADVVDVVDMDWEDHGMGSSFDVILGSEVIYQTPVIKALSSFLHQALRPGGTFFVCEPTGRCQDGVPLLPRFVANMSDLGFAVSTLELEERDQEFRLLSFRLPQ